MRSESGNRREPGRIAGIRVSGVTLAAAVDLAGTVRGPARGATCPPQVQGVAIAVAVVDSLVDSDQSALLGTGVHKAKTIAVSCGTGVE